MNHFWFKLRRSGFGIEYFADKIVNDTIDGEEYYILTYEYNGKQYQEEVLASEVMEYIEDGTWVKIENRDEQ
jgi:hypothetical protein